MQRTELNEGATQEDNPPRRSAEADITLEGTERYILCGGVTTECGPGWGSGDRRGRPEWQFERCACYGVINGTGSTARDGAAYANALCGRVWCLGAEKAQV